MGGQLSTEPSTRDAVAVLRARYLPKAKPEKSSILHRFASGGIPPPGDEPLQLVTQPSLASIGDQQGHRPLVAQPSLVSLGQQPDHQPDQPDQPAYQSAAQRLVAQPSLTSLGELPATQPARVQRSRKIRLDLRTTKLPAVVVLRNALRCRWAGVYLLIVELVPQSTQPVQQQDMQLEGAWVRTFASQLRALQATVSVVAFFPRGVFFALRALVLDEEVDIDSLVELLASDFPSLQMLTATVVVDRIDPKTELSFEDAQCAKTLQRLFLEFHARPLLPNSNGWRTLSLHGKLPRLTHFELTADTFFMVNIGPLATMLVKSTALRHLSFRFCRAWRITDGVGASMQDIAVQWLGWRPQRARNFFAQAGFHRTLKRLYVTETPGPGTMDRVHRQVRNAADFLIEGHEMLSAPLQAVNLLSSSPNEMVLFVHLTTPCKKIKLFCEDVHGWLLDYHPVPRCLLLAAYFPNLREMEILSAAQLTTAGLWSLGEALRHLMHMKLMHNSNTEMHHFALRSTSLVSLCVSSFHSIDTFCLDLPALRILEMDNCDNGRVAEHDILPALYWNRTFQDRLLVRLLGSKSTLPPAYSTRDINLLPVKMKHTGRIRAPNLRVLRLWHDRPPPDNELFHEHYPAEMLECLVGHRCLEILETRNLCHFRSVILQKLPRLRVVSMTADEPEVAIRKVGVSGPDPVTKKKATLAIPSAIKVDIDLPYVSRFI